MSELSNHSVSKNMLDSDVEPMMGDKGIKFLLACRICPIVFFILSICNLSE